MSELRKFVHEKTNRALLYIVLDAIYIDFSILAGIGLWFDGSIPGGMGVAVPNSAWIWYLCMAVIAPFVCWIVYGIFKFYSNLWEYAAAEDALKMVIANTFIFLILFAVNSFFLKKFELLILPKRMLFTSALINIFLCVFSRFGGRILKRTFNFIGHVVSRKAGYKRVMIVGAGNSGNDVIKHIMKNEKMFENRTPVLVVDDDLEKNNTNINGIRVVCSTDNIPKLAREYNIDEIIIAIPTADNAQLKRIIGKCTLTECSLKMVPPLSDISDGFKNALRDINILDLLSRDEINIDIASISGYLKGKTVLVTGGGGSIGSELCRQIAKFSPKSLIIFDIYENSAFELANELRERYFNKTEFIVRIGSVRDIKRMESIFDEFRPVTVFHAAAHKHVSLMEECPAEAVKNNIFGTMNVAECADRFGTERFVLLSTDKAVNPTNVMGATKRVTELIIQKMAAVSKTKFMAVRFGNVLGSNGSVIPIFQRQIRLGGPVTVTDPEVSRYFMTIPEAARLVLQAGGMGRSGRIFVLDMGEPVKINDLAKNLIRLSGYVPGKDIDIVYVGLRQGEKLYEELIMDDEKENMSVTYHNKIFITKPVHIDYELFDKQLEELFYASVNKPDRVLELLHDILPNFK